MTPITTKIFCLASLLMLLSPFATAIESCEKDGEIIFTKECLEQMLQKEKEQQAKKEEKRKEQQPRPEQSPKTESSIETQPDTKTTQMPPAAERKQSKDKEEAEPKPIEQPQRLPLADLEAAMEEKEKNIAKQPPAPKSSDTETKDLNEHKPDEPEPADTTESASQKPVKKRQFIENKKDNPPASASQNTSCKALEFIRAAEQGDLPFIKTCAIDPGLLEAADIRADSRGRTALHWAIANNHQSTIEYLLSINSPINIRSRSDMGGAAIHIAAESGNRKNVELLLERGSSIVASDLLKQTPLHRASKRGQLEVVRLLLDKGSSANAEDRVGKTPLIAASQTGNLKLIKLLKNKGGNINHSTSSGMTALHYAAENSTATARYLIDSGADLDATNNEGETPLSALVRRDINRYWPTIQLLINSGASLDQQDMRGETILDISLTRGHLPLFKLLLAKGIETRELRISELRGKPMFVEALQDMNLL